MTKEGIEEYFVSRQLKDALPSGNLKSLQLGQDLLTSQRIQAISINLQDTGVYFTGMVAAAMKKKVSYSFKIKVSSQGELLNSDCECPAGKGPSSTCKHIACIALMLVQFKTDGEVAASKTCTEILQTFHKPKQVMKGPPPKIEDLKPELKHKLQDPRTGPGACKDCPAYNDMVRNLVINYKANTGKNTSYLAVAMPGKADIQAAAEDHCYLAHPITHYMVERMTKVTDDEAKTLEENTRKQALSSEWKEARRLRLTASNFGVICKMTDRRDLQKMCDSLYNDLPFKTAAMEHGIKNEKVARKMLEGKEDVKVQAAGLFINPNYPHLGASTDGFIGSNTVVEIKCPYSGRDEAIKPGKNFPYLGYSSDGCLTLLTKSNYSYQVQGQMFLTGRKFCKFVVYTHVDLQVLDISLDVQFCIESLILPLERFYDEHYKKYLAAKM